MEFKVNWQKSIFGEFVTSFNVPIASYIQKFGHVS
jgi:hypothetical protein